MTSPSQCLKDVIVRDRLNLFTSKLRESKSTQLGATISRILVQVSLRILDCSESLSVLDVSGWWCDDHDKQLLTVCINSGRLLGTSQAEPPRAIHHIRIALYIIQAAVIELWISLVLPFGCDQFKRLIKTHNHRTAFETWTTFSSIILFEQTDMKAPVANGSHWQTHSPRCVQPMPCPCTA